MKSINMLKELHRGCRENDLMLVSMLLDQHGSSLVNIRDQQGRTALHIAALCNNQLLAELLFRHGANTCSVSDQGEMALDCASHDDMVVLLAKMMSRDGEEDLVRERISYVNKYSKLKQRIINELESVSAEQQALYLSESQVGKRRSAFSNFVGMLENDSHRYSVSTFSDSDRLSIFDSGYSGMEKIESSQSDISFCESFRTCFSSQTKELMSKQRRATAPNISEEVNVIGSTRNTLQEQKTSINKNIKARRNTHPTRAIPKSMNKNAIAKKNKHVRFPSEVLLDIAIMNDEFLEACHLIKSRKVDINRPGPNGLTPLHRAAIEGSYDCLQLLIDQGAKVDIKDENGCTPLHDAVYHGNISCVLALLRAGANVSLQANNWLSVVELANEEEVLLVVGRALILYELGFVSDIGEDTEESLLTGDPNRESCV